MSRRQSLLQLSERGKHPGGRSSCSSPPREETRSVLAIAELLGTLSPGSLPDGSNLRTLEQWRKKEDRLPADPIKRKRVPRCCKGIEIWSDVHYHHKYSEHSILQVYHTHYTLITQEESEYTIPTTLYCIARYSIVHCHHESSE